MKIRSNVTSLFSKIRVPILILVLLSGTMCITGCDLESYVEKYMAEETSSNVSVNETIADTTVTNESTTEETTTADKLDFAEVLFGANNIPAYTGGSYVEINGNVPYFDGAVLPTVSSEYYSGLDALGRCGVVYACVGKDILPTEERGEIGMVKPSGWHTVKYNGLVEGNYLYNRCHLIGYQLTGENANVNNLITGTRSMNVEGMMPFENKVENYVKDTGNHVMYRVTPVFYGDNLLATGVLMEAKSVEDNGEGVQFCIFVYNVQKGIVIDYATGESYLDETATTEKQTTQEQQTTSQEPTTVGATGKYAVNMNNGKIHIVGDCSATGDGEHAMNHPMYFDTYEEAEAYSIQIAPNQKKRQCGNCW